MKGIAGFSENPGEVLFSQTITQDMIRRGFDVNQKQSANQAGLGPIESRKLEAKYSKMLQKRMNNIKSISSYICLH